MARSDNKLALTVMHMTVLAISISPGLSTSATFKVAVVDQALVQSNNATTREQALKTIYGNLANMEKYAQAASKEGVKMIVYPEYGITGWMDGPKQTRSTVYPFLEYIPDSSNGSCYVDCKTPSLPGREVQTTLACLAKTYSLYVSGNMIAAQACDILQDHDCPPDNHYMYNTNLVFNPEGCLIAKYHKYHLVEEEPQRLNHPREPEYVYFDTDYGRFGVLICADGAFIQPSAGLVEKYKIDHLIFPMAWSNTHTPVYMMSTEWQYAFAARFNVNVLSANTHDITDGYMGSGVFQPQKVVNYVYNYKNQNSSLVVAELPIGKPRREGAIKRTLQRPKNLKHYQTHHWQTETPIPDGQIEIYGDTYNAVILHGLSNSTSVCFKDFCCSVKFARNSSDEFYVLAAFKGVHTMDQTEALENCIVYNCPSQQLESCSSRQNASLTSFPYFKLSATFSTEYVFPNVLPSHFAFAKFKWNFHRINFLQNVLSSNSDWPLVSASLIGINS